MIKCRKRNCAGCSVRSGVYRYLYSGDPFVSRDLGFHSFKPTYGLTIMGWMIIIRPVLVGLLGYVSFQTNIDAKIKSFGGKIVD